MPFFRNGDTSHLNLHLKRLGGIIVSYIEAINRANRFMRGEIDEVHLGR